ncbi:MAG TPA: DNA polymerase III subunit gamma/tau [Pyrinomonadaceae bacterium]|nr:DNA polymerase III subunit gamma/tau [Pyrinomonadaceae bacterium]
MSYQVIARKWRPQTFEEVTGQEIITQTLRNALEHDRLHHAYLFSGARGVGKTTTARILAKALNCHKTKDKPNLTPCLLTDPDPCPSCVEISESRSIDVLEIDAASHTGIDDVRETIIENINFNPTRDRYRVFIVDEVHQLSKPAFNALLKTLEEPPENVVFVMATTELHKVPDTILSRCQEFEFRTIPLQKIFDRLKLIANAEKINIDDDALRELARSGTGSMRDAQSNFDQVISFSGEHITAPDVTNALGFAGVEVLSKVISAITEKDPKQVLAVVDDLIGRGHDLRNFCRDVLGLFRDLLVFKVAGDESKLFETAVFNADQMRQMSGAFTEADLLRFFNSLCETEASLREAAHPRYVLEVGLIKLIEMRGVTGIESILERLNALTSGTPLLSVPRPSATGDISSAATAVPPPAQEKKTLKIDPPVAEVSSIEATVIEAPPVELTPKADPKPIADPTPQIETSPAFEQESQFADEPPDYISDLDEPVFEPPVAPEPVKERFTAPPTRLARLSADELDHFEDKKLDDAYEAKLGIVGDDLLPFKSADKLIEALFGETIVDPVIEPRQRPVTNGSSSAAAVAPTLEAIKLRDEMVPKVEDVELPALTADPTEEELLAYANAHPSVRAAMRVFRAKIIEVDRI